MSSRLAVIIGNSDYSDATLAKLISPDADAVGLAEVLKDPAIGGFDEVKLLRNENLFEVTRSIAQLFSSKKPDDLLLLYFSGHGVRDEYGRLYLTVKETERELLSATAISSAFITDEMDRSRSKRQVLILDCCHSGAFEHGTKSSFPGSVGTASTFEGEGYGRFVLTATDSIQYAWEGDQIIGDSDRSVFTHYLIEGLQSGEADLDLDGLITLDELYEFVYQRISGTTSRQTPSKWTYKAQGDVVIARNPKSKSFSALSLRIPGELQKAIVSTFIGVRTGAISELVRLLSEADEELSADSKLALEYLINDADPSVANAASEALLGMIPLGLPSVVAEGRARVIANENKITIRLPPGPNVSLIQIPSGKFLMGSRQDERHSQKNEFPQHAVQLSEFWIGQYPITVKQFAGFVSATDYRTIAERRGGGQAWKGFKWQFVEGGSWRSPLGPGSKRKNTNIDPVVFISWHDAIAYCKWASAVTGMMIDLPTEAQWEKAARGTDGRSWPWGNKVPGTSLCNFALHVKQTSPVGTYSPDGDSYYRCVDVAGNVWEWTNSVLRRYPYQDEYDGSVLGKKDTRVLRGGSFRSFAQRVRCAFRMEQPIDACIDGYGFRIVALIDSNKLSEYSSIVV